MGNPGIFLIQPNGDLVEMNEEPYNSEDLLQTLLAKYPSLLAGNQIDPKAPRKWLFIEREASVPSMDGGGGRWSADHLFLDQDAIPTIVEVKRSTDTRIRREVVGQMLDYAANAVVYWPANRLREKFAKTNGETADDKLNDFLEDQMEPEQFWRLADENLQDRNIRLLFVADEIPTELQRIVEFLNEQMDKTEVLALEVKQFVGGDRTGLVPRVIGQTAEAQRKKIGGTRPMKQDEESFFRSLAANASQQESEIAKKILRWSEERFSYIKWGGASFVPVLDCSPHSHNPITVSLKPGLKGGIGIKFGRMKNRNQLSDAHRLELLTRLNGIPGLNLPEESIAKYPRIPWSVLMSDTALAGFFDAIGWSVNEVKKTIANSSHTS
jgi:hypothetical protein